MSTTMNRLIALIVGSLLATTLGYDTVFVSSAPIQWRGRVVMPKGPAELFMGSAAPQQLLIKDPPNIMSRENVPYFTLNSDNTITLEGTGSCIEAANANSGNPVHLTRCNGEPTQKWNWIPDSHGGNHIQLKDTDKCLEASVEGGISGVPIVLRECERKGAEAWKFEERVPPPKQGRYMVMKLIAFAGIVASSLGALLWQYTGRRKLVLTRGGATSNVEDGGVSLSLPLAMRTTASPGNASRRSGDVSMNAAKTYKLCYFDIRGLAETSRLLFAVAKQPYEDIRLSLAFGTPGDFKTITRPEFDAMKASGDLDVSLGKVPYLEVDGVKFGQSKAIERYLSKQFGMMGSTDLEAAQVEQLCESVNDFKTAFSRIRGPPGPLNDEKQAAVDKFFAETLPESLKLAEKSMPAGSGPWLIGDKVSLADIVFYQFLAAPGGFFDNAEAAKAAFQECPRIKAAMEAVDAIPELKEYLAKRKETPF